MPSRRNKSPSLPAGIARRERIARCRSESGTARVLDPGGERSGEYVAFGPQGVRDCEGLRDRRVSEVASVPKRGQSRQRYVLRHRVHRSERRWHGQRFFGLQAVGLGRCRAVGLFRVPQGPHTRRLAPSKVRFLVRAAPSPQSTTSEDGSLWGARNAEIILQNSDLSEI